MDFWNINLDDWIRKWHNLDGSIQAYTFHLNDWLDNDSWYGDNSVWYTTDLPDREDLLLEEEEFEDMPYDNKQKWPEETALEEYQTLPKVQLSPEQSISYSYYINAIPAAVIRSSRRRKTRKVKRSLTRLSSSDNARTFLHPEAEVLYAEENAVERGEGDKQDHYPLEIARSDDSIRIVMQMPLVVDKNNIKVKIYNDSSIEVSIDNDNTPQKNKSYYRIIEVPKDADIETAKCTYRNGILEIIFKQKKCK
jgi:HSP20 family molecular chaperone IbpA